MSRRKSAAAAIEELTLSPLVRPEMRLMMLPVDAIDATGLIGPDPSRNLIDSIRAHGVLQPVVVEEIDEGRWRLRCGRRRWLAVRSLGEPAIPAAVVKFDGWHDAELLTIIENTLRDQNAVGMLAAIRSLQEKGHSASQIAHASGMTRQELNRYLLLLTMHPSLHDALLAGQVALGVAVQAAKLPAHYQELLATKLAEQGKLTGEDVKAIRAVEAAAVPQSVFEDLLQGTETPREPRDDERSPVELLGILRTKVAALPINRTNQLVAQQLLDRVLAYLTNPESPAPERPAPVATTDQPETAVVADVTCTTCHDRGRTLIEMHDGTREDVPCPDCQDSRIL